MTGKPLKHLDCGKPCKSFGLDVTLPDDQWRMIHDSEGGILRANCMVARAAKLKGAVAVRAQIKIASFTAEKNHKRPRRYGTVGFEQNHHQRITMEKLRITSLSKKRNGSKIVRD